MQEVLEPKPRGVSAGEQGQEDGDEGWAGWRSLLLPYSLLIHALKAVAALAPSIFISLSLQGQHAAPLRRLRDRDAWPWRAPRPSLKGEQGKRSWEWSACPGGVGETPGVPESFIPLLRGLFLGLPIRR